MFRSYVVDVIPENGGEPCREFVTPDYEGEVYVDGQRVEEPCTRRCESVVTKTLVQETTAAAAETTTEAGPEPTDPVPEPTDCIFHWGEWTECDVTCGLGTQERVYFLDQEATNGGKYMYIF